MVVKGRRQAEARLKDRGVVAALFNVPAMGGFGEFVCGARRLAGWHLLAGTA
jgi:hypothetical protein